MPELRHDPVSGRRVIVAPERDARPHSSQPLSDATNPPPECPFCHGNEHATPPEVLRTGTGAPNTTGWAVRVVPNLYPIVGGEHATTGATGAHEVVVLCTDHFRTFGMLDDDQAVDVFTVLRDRTRTHLATGHRHVQVFINHGKEAGASLSHPHAQVVALDFVPPATDAALARFSAAGADIVDQQITEVDGGPLAVSGGPAPAWCPHASGSPYEIRVAHRAARATFADATADEIRAVAIALRDALARLAVTVGDVPYNVILHSAPPSAPDLSLAPGPSFHWYIEVLPRLNIVAGFEMGTGVFVNIGLPEVAAARLRDGDPGAGA
ncbi:MAG: galactose-1-phosphate uridylyltransferase [Acidimicrobiia bacterium]